MAEDQLQQETLKRTQLLKDSTAVVGLLKGDGSAITAAIPNTDYALPGQGSPIQDYSNGKYYMVVSDSGVIGLQEIVNSAIPTVITDNSNGKKYKVISNNGEVGLEEI